MPLPFTGYKHFLSYPGVPETYLVGLYSASDDTVDTVLRDKRAGDVSPRHHFPIALHRLSARLTPIQEPSRDITQLEIAVCNTRRVNGYPITR